MYRVCSMTAFTSNHVDMAFPGCRGTTDPLPASMAGKVSSLLPDPDCLIPATGRNVVAMVVKTVLPAA